MVSKFLSTVIKTTGMFEVFRKYIARAAGLQLHECGVICPYGHGLITLFGRNRVKAVHAGHLDIKEYQVDRSLA